MGLNVTKILNKRVWTGEEVGKLLMASLTHDIKHSAEPDHKPLFDQKDYARMSSNLKTQRDCFILHVYSTLYESLMTLFNKSQLLIQQILHGYYRYLTHIHICTYAELEQSRIQACKTDWKPILDGFTLEKLQNDEEFYDFTKREIIGCVKLMEHAYRYICAYNIVVETLGEVYSIDGIEALKQKGVSDAQGRFQAVNDLRTYLLNHLSGTQEEKRRKKEMLDEFLHPIEYRAWQLSPDAISSAKEHLKGIGFRNDAARELFQRELDAFIRNLAGMR